MNEKMRSYVTGLMLGQFSSPLPTAQKEPERQLIGYSYNGVVLPDINEVWTDKEMYPYAYLCRFEDTEEDGSFYGYLLYLSNTKAYHASFMPGLLMIPARSNFAVYSIADGTSEYVVKYVEENTRIFAALEYPPDEVPETIVYKCIWCSADICGEEDTDTVYLAASEPIPVGSEPEKPTTFTPDPISMTMGWIVGRRIAGQRGKIQPDIPDVPDVPSGVYDDTFPIEWNTLAVLGNPTVTSGDRELVKVSNLTPTAEEMANTIMRGTFRGNWYDFPCSDSQSLDFGHVALYGILLAFVVTTAGQSELGVNFPETGIYVLNDGNDGTDEGYAIQEAPKTPIAYLYNGVQLPDINTVWTDKETYPYAILVGLPGTMLGMGEDVVIYSICMVGAQPTIVHRTFGYVATVPSGTKIEGRSTTNSEDASNAISPELLPVWKWGVSEYREAGENESLGGAEYMLWSSHDILNEDGTTYLAASEPVPVYE